MDKANAPKSRWGLLALALLPLAPAGVYGLIALDVWRHTSPAWSWWALPLLLCGICLAVTAYALVEFLRARNGLAAVLSGVLPHLIVCLTLVVALGVVPSLLRARKRPSGTTMKNDLRLIDAAKDQNAMPASAAGQPPSTPPAKR